MAIAKKAEWDYVVVPKDIYCGIFPALPVKLDESGAAYVVTDPSVVEDGQICESRLYLDEAFIDDVCGLPCRVGLYGPDFDESDCKLIPTGHLII